MTPDSAYFAPLLPPLQVKGNNFSVCLLSGNTQKGVDFMHKNINLFHGY